MSATPTECPIRPLTEPRQKLRILIVEDNKDAADSLARLLALFGYEAEIARDGFAALQKAREFEPGVILLDIGLPGINGYDVARQLGELPSGKKPLLLAMTGYGGPEARRKSSEAGISLHLVKPVNPGDLRAFLERVARTTS
jgi:CheY-like chemotaxis protein